MILWKDIKNTILTVFNCVWCVFWMTIGLPLTFWILFLVNPNRK